MRGFQLFCFNGRGNFLRATRFIGGALRNKFIFEFRDKTLHRPGTSLAECADGAATGNVVGNLHEIIGIARAAFAVREAMQCLGSSTANLRDRACIGRSFHARKISDRFASASTMSVESSITMIALDPLMEPATASESKSLRQIEACRSHQNFFALGVLLLELEFFARLENFRGRTTGNDGFNVRPSRRPPPNFGC